MTLDHLQATTYKLLAIVGPTASGKSELAVKLAKKFNGEIISCDSRQIYRGLDLGTGKVPGKWIRRFLRGRAKISEYVYKDVIHHLVDSVKPNRQYSVSLFQKQAQKIIADILKRGKLPILCGGTGLWIDAVVYNQQLPDVKPNKKLRAELEKKSVDDLFKQLQKLDLNRSSTIDRHNKRRLIRALEIIISTGKPVPSSPSSLTSSPYSTLWLGIQTNQEDLYKKIDKRLKQRMKAGMVKEVQKLRKQGLSWKRLESFGLEYKFIALYLQKKLSYDEMLEQLSYAIKHYSKRQLTWWKRNKEIHWIKPEINSKNISAFLSL